MALVRLGKRALVGLFGKIDAETSATVRLYGLDKSPEVLSASSEVPASGRLYATRPRVPKLTRIRNTEIDLMS